MSTTYYPLQSPVTHLFVESAGDHSVLHIWVDHGKAGSLVIRSASLPRLLKLFANEGGMEITLAQGAPGALRLEHAYANEAMLFAAQFISEHGDLVTFEELKGMATR